MSVISFGLSYVCILFILKVTVYPKLSIVTILTLTTLLVVLLIVTNYSKTEHFQDKLVTKPMISHYVSKIAPGTTSATQANLKTVMTENLNLINSNNSLVAYYSIYSPISYSTSSTKWSNLIGPGELKLSEPPSNIVNDVIDAYNSGMPLGRITYTGGPSSSLGIKADGSYTIFIQIRFGTMTEDTEPRNILSMFCGSGASTSNQGLILRLTDVKNATSIQTANVSLELSNNTTLVATYRGHTQIPVDANMTYCFVIHKEPTSVRMTYISSANTTPEVLIMASDLKESHPFLNIPMQMNPNKNVTGAILAFCCYNSRIDEEVTKTVLGYLVNAQKMITDVNYQDALIMIYKLEMQYRDATICPYDTNTCQACNNVTDWSKFDQIISSKQDCLNAIVSFCSKNEANKKTKNCLCWNDKSPSYNTTACEVMRNAFMGIKCNGTTKTSPASNPPQAKPNQLESLMFSSSTFSPSQPPSHPPSRTLPQLMTPSSPSSPSSPSPPSPPSSPSSPPKTQTETPQPKCPTPEPAQPKCPTPEPAQPKCPTPEPAQPKCPTPEPAQPKCPMPPPPPPPQPKCNPPPSKCPSETPPPTCGAQPMPTPILKPHPGSSSKPLEDMPQNPFPEEDVKKTKAPWYEKLEDSMFSWIDDMF